MKHVGDIKKLDGLLLEPVDCIIGGSPCQDLSVAGKRAGLAGERSGLFMEQIRIVKEMRMAYGKPRYMVWENVPGALSSQKGDDFLAVLEECCKIKDEAAVIPKPPKGKWGGCGCIMGNGYSIAWRIMDAQYWGVPQRRRRIALVCDFGGYTAHEILFKPESMHRNPEESGTQGQKTAIKTESGTGNTGMYIFKGGNGAKAGLNLSETTAPTLTSAGSGTNQASTICIQGNCIDRPDDRSAVTQICLLNDQGGSSISAVDNAQTAPTIRAEMHGNVPAVYDARGNGDGTVAPTLAGDHQNRVTDYTAITYQTVTGTLMANSHPGRYSGQDAYNDMLVARPLRAQSQDSHREDSSTYPIQNGVRRLTPLECERLQGYPDGWTDIGDWTDSKGKLHKTSDSARYKALGNSIALPPWRFVLKEICKHLPVDAMLGSLFDGIGGFPLIWEEINGKGTALWASEIEEFPIAVTKKHFMDVITGGNND